MELNVSVSGNTVKTQVNGNVVDSEEHTGNYYRIQRNEGEMGFLRHSGSVPGG